MIDNNNGAAYSCSDVPIGFLGQKRWYIRRKKNICLSVAFGPENISFSLNSIEQRELPWFRRLKITVISIFKRIFIFPKRRIFRIWYNESRNKIR